MTFNSTFLMSMQMNYSLFVPLALSAITKMQHSELINTKQNMPNMLKSIHMLIPV